MHEWRKIVAMVIYVSLIVALLGLLMYALSTNGKVAAIGLHCFWVGLLVFLLRFDAATLAIRRIGP